MEIAGWTIAALDDHPGTVTHARVARRAVDVEPFLAALKHFHRNREGHHVALLAVLQAGVKVLVLVELSARYGVLHLRPRRASVREKSVPRCGMNFGWSCISWRQPAGRPAAANAHTRRNLSRRALEPRTSNLEPDRINTLPPPPKPAELLEKRPRLHDRELRIVRLKAEEELVVVAPLRKLGALNSG